MACELRLQLKFELSESTVTAAWSAKLLPFICAHAMYSSLGWCTGYVFSCVLFRAD